MFFTICSYKAAYVSWIRQALREYQKHMKNYPGSVMKPRVEGEFDFKIKAYFLGPEGVGASSLVSRYNSSTSKIGDWNVKVNR